MYLVRKHDWISHEILYLVSVKEFMLLVCMYNVLTENKIYLILSKTRLDFLWDFVSCVGYSVACMLWQNKTGFLMRLYIVTKQDWISHKIVCCDKTRLDFSWDCMLWQNKTGFLMRFCILKSKNKICLMR